jgi:hypothetical protein
MKSKSNNLMQSFNVDFFNEYLNSNYFEHYDSSNSLQKITNDFYERK